MQIRGIVLITLILLSGCTDKNLEVEKRELQEKVVQLASELEQVKLANEENKNKVDHDYSRRMAIFNQGEHLAGISVGCRVLFNVCPDAVLVPGNAALAKGHSGGGTFAYWSIFMTKCLFFTGLIWISLVLWSKRLRPDLQAQKLADDAIDKARTDLIEVNSLLVKAKIELAEIKESRKQSAEKWDKLQAEMRLGEKKIVELEKATASKKSMLTALGSFKL